MHTNWNYGFLEAVEVVVSSPYPINTGLAPLLLSTRLFIPFSGNRDVVVLVNFKSSAVLLLDLN